MTANPKMPAGVQNSSGPEQASPARDGDVRRCRPVAVWSALAVILATVATLLPFTAPRVADLLLGAPPAGRDLDFSTEIVDRDGRLLRPYATPDGRWRLKARVADVDPRFFPVLYAYEDRRYLSHGGVDIRALVRACGQFLAHLRIVSGASTLTMQVARLLEPRTERTLAAKARQALRAIQLEAALSKDEILSLYLSLAPYGGNLEGIRAASLAYFGKEPRRLSLSEIALLVALPQSPEARRPDRSAATARRARDRVLDRIAAQGIVAPEDIARAREAPVSPARIAMPVLAPHAADAAAAEKNRRPRLTIDATLQKSLQDLARERARQQGADISVAILAADHVSGEILAHVGSADYFDVRRSGQVDMTNAVRSPGSTLKPFIYGLGFEDGFLHPETLVEDRPRRYGSYAPENFDLSFQGTVSVRKALQLSLNVPAVAVLDRVGPNRLTARLAHAGGALVLPPGEIPGLAMGLGGVGIRLADLVTLYGGLARGGLSVPLAIRADATEERAPRRLLDPVASWYVGNVLLGTPPPENASGGRIAFKTGTSYGYRDAWALGFDGKRVIGVWVGRPDGAPVAGMTGRNAAAPILFDAFARLGKPLVPLAAAPKGALFATQARLPGPLQRFGSLPGAAGGLPLKILFPPHGARLDVGAGEGASDRLALKYAGGVKPVTILMDGRPLPTAGQRRTVLVPKPGPGFVRFTVMDATGASDSVVVRLP
ncbi:penicillin-binding protein 1C [Xanthobacteraceae bacterium Astr-EGSB]|nr:penicillin-binding protein 1C [Xanthobacteraceae bacterium Astr-EGSB]